MDDNQSLSDEESAESKLGTYEEVLATFNNFRANNKNVVLESRAALEALRAGVVNRFVVQRMTCGQEDRLKRLCSHIEQKPSGSVQVLAGGYGTGKSHLSELLAGTLEQRGFAVARLEMGASHGRAENPRSVVSAIEQSLTFTIDGRVFQGASDLAMVLRAIGPDGWYFNKEQELIQNIYRRLPGRTKFLARFDILRREIPQFWGLIGTDYFPTLSLTLDVPHSMSTTNKAVAKLNWLAHQLRKIEVLGLVLILDEAERAEWATNSYRAERAQDMMIGLALASDNRDTSALKHHRNVLSSGYRPYAPSYMHVVFAFTHRQGLCQQICQQTDMTPEVLQSFDEKDKDSIKLQLIVLYALAYGMENMHSLDAFDEQKIKNHTVSEDIRSFIRCLIAALDHRRLQGK